MDVVIWNSGSKDTVFRTLGAYKIAHASRKAGYTAQVIDFINMMTEDELYRCTVKFITSETLALGISTTFLMNRNTALPAAVVNVLNMIADEFPDLQIVFGGAQARDTLKDINLKAKFSVVVEYGEDVFVELLENYRYKKSLPQFQLAFRGSKAIRIFKNATTARYNIETDDHLFTQQDYIMQNETLPIEISRGCIFKCKFCNHFLLGRGKLDYLRSMECIKQELVHNYENWQVTNYYVICDTFNDTEYKMQQWHKMVMSLPFKIRYTAYLRADLLDRYKDVPHMLKESGLLASYHGIESLGVEASRIVGKAWSGKRARDYIPHLYYDIWGKQVLPTLSFIAGLPGDTRESITDTVRWFESNDLHRLTLQRLGLNHNMKNKHVSEFELNSEKYGYSFPWPDTSYRWKTDYWDFLEATEFVKSLQPDIARISARHASWDSMTLLQFGFTEDQLVKEISQSEIFDEAHTKEFTTAWVKKYINRVLTE